MRLMAQAVSTLTSYVKYQKKHPTGVGGHSQLLALCCTPTPTPQLLSCLHGGTQQIFIEWILNE